MQAVANRPTAASEAIRIDINNLLLAYCIIFTKADEIGNDKRPGKIRRSANCGLFAGSGYYLFENSGNFLITLR
jgi:hypothetical protein